MDVDADVETRAVTSILAASSIPEAFRARVALSPNAIAYRQFVNGVWQDTSWEMVAEAVTARRVLLRAAGLRPGDRMGIFLPNGVEWVCFDIAAQSNGIVTVPLYIRDSARNIRHVIRDSGAALCVTDTVERWDTLEDPEDLPLEELKTVWVLDNFAVRADKRVKACPTLPAQECVVELRCPPKKSDLATIIYTSGTTGPPKGVMLSQEAVLWNARAVLDINPVGPGDEFLSILPLAHGFERIIGWLAPLVGGATVTYCRSIETLSDDLREVSPTVLLAVPRLFEKIRAKVWAEASRSLLSWTLLKMTETVGWRRTQSKSVFSVTVLLDQIFWRLIGHSIAAKVRRVFGSRIRIILTGGAPISDEVGRFMAAMELPLIEGYGLTEAGPAVTGSTVEDRLIGSVGRALPGAELRLGEQAELQVRSPGVMLGYWRNPKATAENVDPDGWLHTGDAARIVGGRVFIRGRIKDVIVLSTGENVNPVPIEKAILSDPLVEQVCVVGDRRNRCLAVVVVEPEGFASWLREIGLEIEGANSTTTAEALCDRLLNKVTDVPEFAKPEGIIVETEAWTPETGLITPTLKPKRAKIEEYYRRALDTEATSKPAARSNKKGVRSSTKANEAEYG